MKFHFLSIFEGESVSSRGKRSLSAHVANSTLPNNGTSPNATISYSVQPQIISVRSWNPNTQAWETNTNLQVHVYTFKVDSICYCILYLKEKSGPEN